jgi:hypothetical protein
MPSGSRRLRRPCPCLVVVDAEHCTAALLAARNAKEFDGNAKSTTDDNIEWREKMRMSVISYPYLLYGSRNESMAEDCSGCGDCRRLP